MKTGMRKLWVLDCVEILTVSLNKMEIHWEILTEK